MSESDIMGFKDILQQDLKNVFLNNNEFADLHEVQGKKMNVIVDDDELMEYATRNGLEGIYKSHKLIKFAKADLGGKPAKGSPITFDKKTYRVAHVNEEDGLLTVILEAMKI